MSAEQTYLPSPYELWDGDFTAIACEDCARKFASERSLEWRGGTSLHSFTEDAEEKGASASSIPSYALGESDSPYSCCDTYLDTNFTSEGVAYLKSDFPAWVQALYGYAE